VGEELDYVLDGKLECVGDLELVFAKGAALFFDWVAGHGPLGARGRAVVGLLLYVDG